MRKEKKWFNPMVDFDEDETKRATKSTTNTQADSSNYEKSSSSPIKHAYLQISNFKNWMKTFDPINVEDLAVNNKKVQELEDWLKLSCGNNCSNLLLLTGPVGCGKTITLRTLSNKHKIKVTEWITPLDIDLPSEQGDYEFKVKQSTKFLEFVLNAANFTSLLDNNSKKIVLVEDFPNTFMRTPSEFTEVLQHYTRKAKSPLVFICSDSNTDNKNTSSSLFTPSVKEQFKIHHILFNSISVTGLKGALKRVSEIISKKYLDVYNTPSPELVHCVVNSSAGDVRSAVLNLHFACLKGSNQSLETSIIEKENKSKTVNSKRKKQASSKFLSLGKDQTVNILHGVGRALNPKVTGSENGIDKYAHPPTEIIEQFLSQPSSFVNFLAENYLPHFSSIDHANKAAARLSDADFMLAEWREKMCQEYGLYTAAAGVLISNKTPVSSWNPVRGPKNMKITYPSPQEFPLLDQDILYKGKVLVADYQTYCKIIGPKT